MSILERFVEEIDKFYFILLFDTLSSERYLTDDVN